MALLQGFLLCMLVAIFCALLFTENCALLFSDYTVFLRCCHMGKFMVNGHFFQVFPKQACLKLTTIIRSKAYFLWHLVVVEHFFHQVDHLVLGDAPSLRRPGQACSLEHREKTHPEQ
jgi:hypothetical protein